MLSVRKLSKSYPGASGRHVLKDLDLYLSAGEYVAIMGESGIGKSTLLNLIAGLDAPDSGSISIAGIDVAALDDRARTLLRRRQLGFVFQAFHLLPHLTVAQNVALPLHLLGVAADAAGERTHAMLDQLGLRARALSWPRELSSGEMQRVAIGRALVHEPRLVLADEPTGNLDPDNAIQVLDLLRREITARGATALLVTHSRAAAATAQRILMLTASGLHNVGPVQP